MKGFFKKHSFKTIFFLVLLLLFASSSAYAENDIATIDFIIFEDNGEYYEVDLDEWAEAFRTGEGDPLYDRFKPPVLIVGIRSGDKYVDLDSYASYYRDLEDVTSAIQAADELDASVVDAIKPYSLKLKVIEVKSITTTSVNLEVEEVKVALQDVTVKVINPAEEVIDVQERNIDEGETRVEFQFIEALDQVKAGLWNVEGLAYEVDPNLKVLLKEGKGTVEVLSDFDIIELSHAALDNVDNSLLLDQDYELGETLLLMAIPDEGHDFNKWVIDGKESLNSQIILNMKDHKEVEVYFELDPEYEFTVTFDEENNVNAQVQVYDSADRTENDKVGEPVSIDNGAVDKPLKAGSYWFTATAENYKDYEGSFDVVDSNVIVDFEMETKEVSATVLELDGILQELVPGAYTVIIPFNEAEDKIGATTDDVLELVKDDQVVAELSYNADKDEFVVFNIQRYTEEQIKDMLVRVK